MPTGLRKTRIDKMRGSRAEAQARARPYQSGDGLAPPGGRKGFLSSAGDLPSPNEGVALIHAFLRIEQPEVRAAIIQLLNSLSDVDPLAVSESGKVDDSRQPGSDAAIPRAALAR